MSQKIRYKIKMDKSILSKPFVFGLAEKPTAAKRIAKVLDSKSRQVSIQITRIEGKEKFELPPTIAHYLEFQGKSVIILSAFGHLYTLVQDGIGWQYPVYDFKWVPLHQIGREKSNFHFRIESALESMKFIAKKAKDHVIMTDYDEEGEVIGGVILSKLLGEKVLGSAKRMKFSTFAKKEVTKSFADMFKKGDRGINLGMYNKGLMRHYLDWLWGINLSRALMLSLKNTSGRYHTLSTGRVQGPTLSFVADREFERNTFVPIPFFKINVRLDTSKGKFDINYNKGNIIKKSDANSLRNKIKDKDAIVSDVIKKKSKSKPPVPYNLSSLQRDAYNYLKITPSRTLQIAEKLYLAASISYPRTGSEKYPSDLQHQEVIKKLNRQSGFKEVGKRLLNLPKLIPIQGSKTDPAHPCIYPTGIRPSNLKGSDSRVYELIVFRYFAGFGKPAIKESNRVEFDIAGHTFHLTGSRTIDLGWKAWAGVLGKTKDIEIPNFRKGSKSSIAKLSVSNNFSKATPAFNQASLLRMMETQEIGTKATRSEIINSIFERKYLDGDPIKITPVGEIVNEVLHKYSPQVNSVELSRQLEKMGTLIENTYNKNGSEFDLQDALTQAILHLHEMLQALKFNENKVGALITRQLGNLRREEIVVGECMECKTGKLKIIKSLASGKRFVGCSNYFEDKSCDTTYPLPQKGKLSIMDKTCKADGYPQIRVFGGKKPWTLCLNPTCVIREEFNKKNSKQKANIKGAKK